MAVTGTPVSGGGAIGFTTAEKLYEKIKKLGSDNNMELQAPDENEVTRRLNDSYNMIVAKLVNRGLTLIEVSTWVRGEEYQLDIALYWYAKASGWGGKIDGEVDWTTVFNRIDELDTIAILNSSGEVLLKDNKRFAVGMNLIEANNLLGDYY